MIQNKICLSILFNRFLFFLLAFFSAICLQGQTKIWTAMPKEILPIEKASQFDTYNLFHLNEKLFLATAKKIEADFLHQSNTFITLPIGDGRETIFKIKAAPILQKSLSKKYPTYQSYNLIAKENGLLQGKMSWTDKGLYAHVLVNETPVFIESVAIEGHKNSYISYRETDQKIKKRTEVACGNRLLKAAKQATSFVEKRNRKENDLKIFRLAVTATEGFTTITGGTKETALSSIINTLTSLNVIYERDLAVRFVLAEENDRLIFTNENPAPFRDITAAFDLWETHPIVLDSLLGAANYDLGHVFATECIGGVSGVAALAGVCSASKAKAVSCVFEEDISEFRRTLYHEIGHQLGANHTWSNCGKSTNEGQRNATTAVEIGSGSTIMSYGGVCGPYNIVSNAQDYFHGISIQEIKETLARDTVTCFEEIPIQNTSPLVAVRNSEFVIPILTPFELSATAFDAENTGLTYSWEQLDTDMVSEVGFPIGNAPSFRAFFPTDDPVRIFPRATDIILNRQSLTEVLPDTTRNLTFGVTVRDNNQEGGSSSFAKVSFSATSAAGPFLVMSPDSANIEYEAGDSIDIRWEVANTDRAPINCAAVDIYLSFNNGQRFSKILAEQVPNTGFTKVILPDTTTNRARIKIKCSNNIFFDISNNRFKIIERLVSAATNTIFQEKISLYPNPTKGTIYLKLPENLLKSVDIAIFDALGRKVWTEKLVPTSDLLPLNTKELPSGIYFLSGKIGEQIFSKRFIKE